MPITAYRSPKSMKCKTCRERIPKEELCIRYTAGWGTQSFSGNLCLKCLVESLTPKDWTEINKAYSIYGL